MKYFKYAAMLLFINICIGSFLKGLNASTQFMNICYSVILAYVLLLGFFGALLLLQIILLTVKFQNKEKEIRSSINGLKIKKKMNIQSFYKQMLIHLDLNAIQKEIVKLLLKIGVSLKILNRINADS